MSTLCLLGQLNWVVYLDHYELYQLFIFLVITTFPIAFIFTLRQNAIDPARAMSSTLPRHCHFNSRLSDKGVTHSILEKGVER